MLLIFMSHLAPHTQTLDKTRTEIVSGCRDPLFRYRKSLINASF